MKTKLFPVIIFILYGLRAFSQQSDIELSIKADHWLDSKNNNKPIYENVTILKTKSNFKVTIGSKVFTYIITSENKFSSLKTDYKVKLSGGKNNLTNTISIALMPNNTFLIGLDEDWSEVEWFVENIKSLH